MIRSIVVSIERKIQSVIDWITGKSYSSFALLLFDLLCVTLSFFIMVAMEYEAEGEQLIKFEGICLTYLISFLLGRTHRCVVRSTGLRDVCRIFACSLFAFGLYVVECYIAERIDVSYSVYFVRPKEFLFVAFVTTTLIVFSRLYVKYQYVRRLYLSGNAVSKSIVYGAESMEDIVLNSCGRVPSMENVDIVAFVNNDNLKIGKNIDGVPILPASMALKESFLKKNNVQTFLIFDVNKNKEENQSVISKALDLKLKVRELTLADEIESRMNRSSVKLKKISIADLLHRPEKVLATDKLKTEIEGKVVMVTGAAGSIGSEIVQQVLRLNPKEVVAIDAAETPMFVLRFNLGSSREFKDKLDKVSFLIANIKDRLFIEKIFSNHRPDIVYHAAAYKHVPLMEENPYEAVCTNVLGTKNMADLAMKYMVKKFVMISTDKAVNPTNVMGATKRLAEIYVQSRTSQTSFITTRFGNVLGSNGSVIPLFKKQISQGGPITLTHRDVIRYFMTIEEACGLVLESSAIGGEKEVYVFDMGNPVRIYDLAKDMIRLSGAEHVEIKEIGLRPGEKLREEILADREKVKPSENPHIFCAKCVEYTETEVDQFVKELETVVDGIDFYDIVKKIKSFVPEYRSNNSVFEKLDR